jgi:glycosyltransferase involved in cell wall biosynthesis
VLYRLGDATHVRRDHRQPGALAAAIDSLLTDPAERRELGHAARQTFERDFRLEQTVAKTVALYRSIMDRAIMSPP